MRFFRETCRSLCLPLAMVMLLVSAPISSPRAAMVTTDEIVGDAGAGGLVAGAADRERIVQFLQQDQVRERLIAMGVAPGEVEARLAALSPAELKQVADRIDAMPAGQSTLGVVLGVILIIFLVLLLTDLLGLTDVFPFVHSQR